MKHYTFISPIGDIKKISPEVLVEQTSQEYILGDQASLFHLAGMSESGIALTDEIQELADFVEKAAKYKTPRKIIKSSIKCEKYNSIILNKEPPIEQAFLTVPNTNLAKGINENFSK